MGRHSIFVIRTTWECTPNIRMHSDVVPIKVFECIPIWSLPETNALPCGPYSFKKCTPIWSLWHFGVHSDVVRNMFWSALPFGPHHFQKCTPKWSPPIKWVNIPVGEHPFIGDSILTFDDGISNILNECL